jgi:hypothetical protein
MSGGTAQCADKPGNASEPAESSTGQPPFWTNAFEFEPVGASHVQQSCPWLSDDASLPCSE